MSVRKSLIRFSQRPTDSGTEHHSIIDGSRRKSEYETFGFSVGIPLLWSSGFLLWVID